MTRQHLFRLAPACVLVVAGLGLASCGSSGSSSPKLSSGRQAIVDRIVTEAAKVGYSLDRGCVEKVVVQLNDADAALLAASAADSSPDATDPDLSDAGDKLGDTVLDCSKGSTNTALINKAIDTLLAESNGEGLDRACLEKSFAKLTDEQLQAVVDAAPDSSDPKLQGAAFAAFTCLDLSGGTETTTATS